jgi:hypothetical protein
MKLRLGLSLFLLSFALTAPRAWADGVMNAVAYQDMPKSMSLHVRPFDDSDDNLAIKRQLERALASKGFESADDGADYIMNFEVRDRIGSLSTGDNRHILSLQAGGGRGGGENSEARVNVYNSQDGGLLNKGSGNRVSNRTIYRLEVNVEQRASGERIWDGWAEAELIGGDSRDLLRRMVPTLVKGLGQTIKREPFEVY